MSVDRSKTISKVVTADSVTHEIVPTKMADSSTSYSASLPTLASDSTIALSSDLTSAVSGTAGCLAKFSGSNKITSGPAIGTSTTTWLNNAGGWSTPSVSNKGVTFAAASTTYTIATVIGTDIKVTTPSTSVARTMAGLSTTDATIDY